MPDTSVYSPPLENGLEKDHIHENNGEINESPIRVFARLRPINKLEASRRSKNCVDVHTDDSIITVDSPVEGEYDYEFDKIFDENASQTTVYTSVASSIPSKLLDGQNCALIAFGQTGSGKSYTMYGPRKDTRIESKEDTETKDTCSETDNQTITSKKSSKTAVTATTTKESEFGDETYLGLPDSADNNAGIIQRTIEDLFSHIKKSNKNIEYSIRCSYLDIYMERIIDLLHLGSHSIMISGNNSNNPQILGASEICCIDETDVISLLRRGNANRKLHTQSLKTSDHRFHSIFIINLTQRDAITGIEKTSRLSLVDLAGSEVASLGLKKKGRTSGVNQQELKFTKKSFTALNNVIKSCTDPSTSRKRRNSRNSGRTKSPYLQSKLTQIMKNAFGGNCYTTIVLTISPASFSISETMATLRFGSRCRQVKNIIQSKSLHPASFYESKLVEARNRERDLMMYIDAMAGKCQTIQTAFMEEKLSEESFKGDLWESINKVKLVSSAQDEDLESSLSTRVIKIFERENDNSNKESRSESGANSALLQSSLEVRDDSDMETLRDEVKQLINNNELIENQLTNSLAQCAELQILNNELTADKKKNMGELIDAQNEIQELSQRKLEVEHNLRISQFRENEATVFLRQFRRFYRRLLHNKAKQGSGGVNEVAEKVPGVPDLKDLIDVDTLLLESGLIEEHEMHDDTGGSGQYRPSSQALIRSYAAAKKANTLERVLEENDTETATNTNDSSSYTRSVGFPSALNVNTAESLPSVSEMGDGGVSVIMANRRLADVNNENKQSVGHNNGTLGADDIESIGQRKNDGLAHPLQGIPPDLGADAGAGASTSDSIESSSVASRSIGFSSVNSMSSYADERQKALSTPAGRLVSVNEKKIEHDLLRMTERCIELQIALNEEKATVDVLTNRTGSLGKKRMAQEAISLRQHLDRKTHDLQAIIWKMNELHLINKTYSEKMENREQHVAYLEESISNLQNRNRTIVNQSKETEKKLREELEKLRFIVDELTVPLWQFGDKIESQKIWSSRVIVHIQGGEEKDSMDPSLLLVNDYPDGDSCTDSSDEDEISEKVEEEQKNDTAPVAAAVLGAGVGAAAGIGAAVAVSSPEDDAPTPIQVTSPGIEENAPKTSTETITSKNSQSPESPELEDALIPAAVGAAALGVGVAAISQVETKDASTQVENIDTTESTTQSDILMKDATTQYENSEYKECFVQTDNTEYKDAEIQTEKFDDSDSSTAIAAVGGLAVGTAVGAGTAAALSDSHSENQNMKEKSLPEQQSSKTVPSNTNNRTATKTNSPAVDNEEASAAVAGLAVGAAVGAGTAAALSDSHTVNQNMKEKSLPEQQSSKTVQSNISNKTTPTINNPSIDDELVATTVLEATDANGPTNETSESLFLGGRTSSYVPRRFVRKVGPEIKSGVLKEHKKRSSKNKEHIHINRSR